MLVEGQDGRDEDVEEDCGRGRERKGSLWLKRMQNRIPGDARPKLKYSSANEVVKP